MTEIETKAAIVKAATDRNKNLHEKFKIERAKKEKQMAVATEFVIDLLASENNGDEYNFMNMNYIWNKIRDFHYEHRPLNRMSRKKSVTAKFSNSQKKYISGITFKHFKFTDLQTILDVLRKDLSENGFVETRPPNGSDTNGTQPDYEYRYNEKTALVVEPAPVTDSATANVATPVAEPISGAGTVSVEEQVPDLEQALTSEQTAEPAQASEMSQTQA